MELVQGKRLSAITRKAAKDMNRSRGAGGTSCASGEPARVRPTRDSESGARRVHRESRRRTPRSFEAREGDDFGIVRALDASRRRTPAASREDEYMSPSSVSRTSIGAPTCSRSGRAVGGGHGPSLFRRDTSSRRCARSSTRSSTRRTSRRRAQLEQISCARCKRSARRFQTAQEMALALERYVSPPRDSRAAARDVSQGSLSTRVRPMEEDCELALRHRGQPASGSQSGTGFPVIKTDLQTRGRPLALRKGQSFFTDQARSAGSDGARATRRPSVARRRAPRLDWVGRRARSRHRARAPSSSEPCAASTRWRRRGGSAWRRARPAYPRNGVRAGRAPRRRRRVRRRTEGRGV